MEILSGLEIGIKPEMAFKPGNVIKDKAGKYYMITSIKERHNDPYKYGITNLDTGKTWVYPELNDLVMLFSGVLDSVLSGTMAVKF